MGKTPIDVFIPVRGGHEHVLPAALCCALTQTYSDKRVILFLDEIHPGLEKAVKEWWYTSEDTPIEVPSKMAGSAHLNRDAIVIEATKRGLLVRNRAGAPGSAHAARQWLFEYPGKAEWIKMLDADDIMTPRALEIISGYITLDLDAVFCPLLKTSGYQYTSFIDGKPEQGHAGSGSMLLSKRMMEDMIQKGFVWPRGQGHDNGFFSFIKDKGYKIVTTKENVLYLYLR